MLAAIDGLRGVRADFRAAWGDKLETLSQREKFRTQYSSQSQLTLQGDLSPSVFFNLSMSADLREA